MTSLYINTLVVVADPLALIVTQRDATINVCLRSEKFHHQQIERREGTSNRHKLIKTFKFDKIGCTQPQ